MSKLFNLKKWVTLDDAAKRLSMTFNEEVKIKDLLQFSIDGHLTISVDFPNKAPGKKTDEVTHPISVFLRQLNDMFGFDSAHKYSINLSQDDYFSDDVRKAVLVATNLDQVLDTDISKILTKKEEFGPVESLYGVFDLEMKYGAEVLDIKHMYQQLTGGPSIELVNLNGVYVLDDNKIKYQLQERFSEDDTESNIEKCSSNVKPFSEYGYFPAGKLPDDSVLVIKTSNLIKFEKSILDDDVESNQSGSFTKEDRWHDVIGTMSLLLFEAKSSLYGKGKDNKNINVSQIAESIKDRLEKGDLNLSSERLSNINKDIGNALKRQPFSSFIGK